MKRITIMAGVLLLLVACGNKEKEYDATGTFEATEVTVSAKSTGELQRFDVTEGQEIDQNVVVGTIDAYQLKLQRQQLENTKEQLKANKKQLNATRGATNSKQLDLEKQVASIRQQIANAQRERQRYNELVNDGAVPRKQLDDINYQIKVLEKQLAAAQEQIRSNNASLKEQSQGITAQMEGIDAQQLTVESQKAQLDDQIANSDIKAPITGSVLEKYVERGEYVTVGKPLFKMADTQNMFIRAYVTSAQLKDIKVGQQVKVFADYGNGQKKSYSRTTGM